MRPSHRSISCSTQMVQLNASDLHITVGSPPVVRLRGHLQRFDGVPSLSADETRDLLYRILSSEQQKRLEINRQLDLAHSIPGVARFRVNVFFQRETLGAAFRLIPNEIKSLEELGLSASLHQLAEKPRGLVLVTGPTGSGKSTTLASVIDEINRTRHDHILTVEDPIEFLHRHKGCIVNQREIGVDATLVRRGPARRAAPGPGRDPRRRDARPRDDRDRDDRGRDRPPRVRHAAHAVARRERSTASSTSSRPSSRSRFACRSPARSRVSSPRRCCRPPTAKAACPRSRSCCRTTPSGT